MASVWGGSPRLRNAAGPPRPSIPCRAGVDSTASGRGEYRSHRHSKPACFVKLCKICAFTRTSAKFTRKRVRYMSRNWCPNAWRANASRPAHFAVWCARPPPEIEGSYWPRLYNSSRKIVFSCRNPARSAMSGSAAFVWFAVTCVLLAGYPSHAQEYMNERELDNGVVLRWTVNNGVVLHDDGAEVGQPRCAASPPIPRQSPGS